MAPHGTLDLYARACGLFLQRDRNRVRKNPMLHEETYINCFMVWRLFGTSIIFVRRGIVVAFAVVIILVRSPTCVSALVVYNYKVRTTELFTFR